MDFILGTAIGGLASFATLIPAIITELFNRHRSVDRPLFVDLQDIWGQKYNRNELFFIAIVVHLFLGMLFGLIYPIFAVNEWLYITHNPYTFESLLVYSLHAWLVVMVIIFPALGFGFFGRREGKLVWIETLLSMLIIGVLMQIAVSFYQPYFFS